MPTIEVTADQHDRLEALREELAEEFVGGYGTVRETDAVEYLLDLHAEAEGLATPDDTDQTAPAGDDDTGGSSEGADDGGETTDDQAADDGDDRLSAMMNLLEDHDGKWRQTEDEDGNYEVDLPDGGVEVVRTKPDVKAVLFEYY